MLLIEEQINTSTLYMLFNQYKVNSLDKIIVILIVQNQELDKMTWETYLIYL